MKKSRKFYLLFIVVISLIIGSCGVKSNQEEGEVVVNRIPVETEEVTKGDFTTNLVISGVINPATQVNVMPKIAGGEKIIALNVKDGQKVAKGQIIATLDQSSASIQLKQAQKSYDDALKNHERNKVLVEAGAIADTNFEQSESQLEQAKNTLASQEIAFANTVITAPISGVVTNVSVEEGTLASSQTTICTIVDLDNLELNSSVNELQINKIKVGQEVNIDVPSAEGKKYKGTVTFINPLMDERSKSYSVKINIANPQNEIKSGMYAKVELITAVHKDVIMVPRKAVNIRDGENKVFLVEDGKAVLKKVEIGLNNGQEIEITNGLSAGEEIVVTGNEDLVDGDLVAVFNRGESE